MTERTPIRVMIVDDHLMVRDGLKSFLSMYDDLEVVGEASNGQKALAVCHQVRPDVILMDIVMPVMDGPTATRILLAEFPSVHVIALTSFTEKELIEQAIQSGAISYLLKDVQSEKLAQAIRDAHRGRTTLASAAAQVLVEAANKPKTLGQDLTDREREILALLVEGKTNKDIAEILTLSPGTVRFHVSNILSKLGVNNRTEAVSLALQKGLVVTEH